MWKTISCFLSILFLVACSPETTQEDPSTSSPPIVNTDNSNAATEKNTNTEESILICDCKADKKHDSQSIRVSFSHWNYLNDKAEFDSIYRQYRHDSICLRIKALTLNGFDTVPAMMHVFKNVEHLYLVGSGQLFGKPAQLAGLNQFPKLISVNIEGCNINIDSTDTWLKKLEALLMIKSKVKGIRSFKQLPHLKSLVIGHSGFDSFPKDLDALTCLREIDIEEYKFGIGHIDLRHMKLHHFTCLKKLRVWGGGAGLPQGLDSIGKIELILRPWAMDEQELKAYKTYKKRIK